MYHALEHDEYHKHMKASRVAKHEWRSFTAPYRLTRDSKRQSTMFHGRHEFSLIHDHITTQNAFKITLQKKKNRQCGKKII